MRLKIPLIRHRPRIEELEPRILYSADFSPGVLAAPLAPAEHRVVDTAGDFLAGTQSEQTVASQEHVRREIIFVDSATPDYQRLVDDIVKHADEGRQLELIRLDSAADGIGQISAALSGRSDISAVHIISHGTQGEVQLGGARLNFDSLLQNAKQIRGWGEALSSDADLLIYGCDVAQDAAGKSLIDALARLTGADVAGSDDATGASDKGGDWTLEYNTGHIDTGLAISADEQAVWSGTLATYTVTSAANSGAGTLRQAISDANGNGGADSIVFNIAGAGVHTINLTSTLDTITGPVTIDGTTQAGFSGTPLIQLNGAGAGAASGLSITGGSSTIRGLIISGFTRDGILLNGSSGNIIAGNYIGTNAAGTAAAANTTSGSSYAGVRIQDSTNNTIGGTSAADRNVISGNTYVGILVTGASTANNLIQGNYVGVDVNGNTALSNGYDAISIESGGHSTTIGGTSAGARNVLSGNMARGIWTDGGGDVIQGNYIGVGADGTTQIGNYQEGIYIKVSNTTVGGTAAGAGNVITYSGRVGGSINGMTWAGVMLSPGASYTGNAIQGNSIYDNTGLGIDLGNSGENDGVTANDAGDGDTGANGLQNFPVVSSASYDGLTLTLSGSLNSVNLTNYRIEFFANSSADASNYGEGRRYLGFTNVTTAGGNAAFLNVNLTVAMTPGETVVATATSAAGNTSEFGLNRAVSFTNSAPVLSGANNLASILEDPSSNNGTLVSSLISGQVTDADPGAVSGIAVTAVDNTNGTWQYTTNAGGQWNSFGTPSAAASRLLTADGNTYVRFVPNANWNGTVNNGITFRAWDQTTGTAGNTADTSSNGGTTAFSSATASASVTVTSVNDAPAGANNAVSTLEGTQYTFAAADFGFTDPNDSPASSLSAVTITAIPGVGSLTLSGAAVTAGQSISVANINSGNLKFAPAADANGTGYASFTFQVQDNGGTANGGVDLDQSANTLTVDVTSVNDAPAGANGTVTASEDTQYTFTAANFGFTDLNDSPANTLSAVTITTVAGAGSLTLSGVAVTAGQSISVANINSGNLKFAPAAGANGAGYTSFTFQVQDNGGTANGGVDLDASANTLTVDVTSINDAPAGADNTVTTLEDTPYTFAAVDFGFNDPNDSPANALSAVKITTIPGVGSLTLSGVAVTAGQTVSAANIAAANLKFSPVANANGAAYATFTFQVQDNGGTADGGVDLDASANTMTVAVTGVNDEPVASNRTLSMFEDGTHAFSALDFGFTDPNDSPANALSAVKITTIPGAGSLTLSGVAVTAGQTVSLANLNAGNLVFAPAANANGVGYTSFTFQVQDDGGTANGGVDLDASANTMTVDLTAVNDAPAGTDNTVTTIQDTQYSFAALDFGFTDPNDAPTNALTAVTITTVPGPGSLTLSGVAVTAGQSITVANINSGNLKFAPAASASGLGYASFTFQVQDNGGTVNGGVNLDQSANTITVNVTPTYTVSGTVYEDVNGDGSVADGVGVNGVTVKLYVDTNANNTADAGDALIGTTATAGGGNYSFTGLANATYWVVVDSKTIAPSAGLNGGFTQADVWAEQTYGVAGAASGAGFAAGAGALYGGKDATVSDNAAALTSAEHITRAVVSGANAGAINSGFSFNAVTGTRDGDDDGAANRSIQGSLRQFLQNANAIAGVQSSNFSIGTGAQTITPTSALMDITDTVVLDATTQEGFGGTPLIILDGNDLAANGLVLADGSDGSTIRGFVIRNFGLDGMDIQAGSDGNTIAGNYIGTLTSAGVDAGAATANAQDGIRVLGANNTIGGLTAADRNVIGGNDGNGIRVTGAAATGNVIRGNYVGTDASGNSGLFDGLQGIFITSSASSTTIGGTAAGAGNVLTGWYALYVNRVDGVTVQGNIVGLNAAGTSGFGNGATGIGVDGSSNVLIGGTAANARNVISGNDDFGIEIYGDGVTAQSITIQGNLIGTNAAGTAAIANESAGIYLGDTVGVLIGGTAAGARNVISGNGGSGSYDSGIFLTDGDNNTIAGNYIGVDITGNVALGNLDEGIVVQNNATGNMIGGNTAAAANVIGANQLGILFEGNTPSGNFVRGNLIGVGADGTSALGNSVAGVEFLFTTTGNFIGGTGAGDGNVIANNGVGITFPGGNTSSTAILGNRIYANISLGIDLTDDGVTANDLGDADIGANRLQNFPVLTSAASDGIQITINGALNSNASRNYRIEFFANSSADPSGYGEGERYLGFANVSTDAGGNVSINATLTAAVAVGETISATATDLTTNDTSEFAASVAATQAFTVSGTVYEDVNGDGSVADGVGVNGVTVKLYVDTNANNTADAGDALIGTTATAGGGNYSFTGLANATYWVVVDSKTIAPSAGLNGGFTQADVWAEQTYGVAGAASGAGFAAGAGALYGGKDATVSDNAAALTSAEHITRAVVSGANAGAINSGFSFNAVTGTRDGDDDGAANRSIQGSLRQFLQNANAIAGVQSSNFSIGTGAQTITPTSALMDITDTVVLDATTQEGFGGTPLIILDGNDLAANGLVLADGSDGSTIRGLIIRDFANNGIKINSGADGNLIAGNYLGRLTAAGTDAGAAEANGQDGLYVSSANNTIGGTAAADRNIVSGNADDGMDIVGATANGNLVLGNYVGTDAAGTSAVGNGNDGVVLWANQNNTIGGSSAGARNVISGNQSGIYIGNVAATNNVVIGNYVGTNAAGTGAIANTTGMFIEGVGNAIGTTAAGEGNLISGNTFTGLWLFGATGITVEGNRIGTDAAGTGALANTRGIYLSAGSTANAIGGTAAGAGNTIAFNGQAGIILLNTADDGNAILRNAVYSNGTLGIDLNNDGVTLNDAGDVDAGVNALQNYPVLQSAGISGGNLTVYFTFSGAASSSFRVELFASSAADASGFGEGQRYLGFANVTTDGSGNATVSSVTVAAAVSAGEFISATATAIATNDTSEFSNTAVAYDRTISGTVYNDVDGDGDIAEGGTLTFAGATVRLYLDDGDGVIDASDVLVGSTTSNGSGLYSFSGLGNATYWVTVDSKTLAAPAYNGGFTAADVWAEQTYGADGAASGGAFLTGAGQLFGGRDATLSDNSVALISSEHVTRAVVAGSSIATVDSGFSFSAIVTTRGDDVDDDGAANRLQQGTLRQFLLNSNAVSGVQTSNFSIDGGGVETVMVTGSALPTITDAVVLDATSQEGFAGTPLIIVDGNRLVADGLTLSADGNTIRGLVIRNFDGNGIRINAGSDNNVIKGNYLGALDETGGLAAGSANTQSGLHVLGANNTIGGTGAADHNVMSANTGGGISISGASATGNIILGNYVGTNAAGTVDVGNADDGLVITGGAQNNTIGGTAAGARNVISGNADDGIDIDGVGTDGNVILGNYIGLNAAGTAALGNDSDGVVIGNSASGNIIGGAAAGAGNVISGNNLEGVRMNNNSTGTIVRGNLIGLNAAGTVTIGNGNDGVSINGGSSNNTIGGTGAGEGNTIAGNETGVQIAGASTGNAILGNSIYGNTDLGIDLGNDGVDVPDGATSVGQPNLRMDSAAIQSALLGGTSLTLTGYVGNAPSSVTFAGARVEFFLSDDDASSYGEGRTYLGFLTANGNSQFSGVLTVAGLNVGDKITATATDAAGNTSEFSFNFTTVADPGAAPVNTVPGLQTINEDTATAIAGISVNDVNTNLATVALGVGNGVLSVNLAGGASISAGANGTGALTLSGTQAQINAALATLSYQGSANFTGADTLTVVSTDAAALSDNDTVSINVVSVNDAPAGTNITITAAEDVAYVFAIADFGFSDPNDSPANTVSGVTVTTIPGAGSLTLSGVAVTAGQVISAANITAGNLRFTAANSASGASYASLTFQVQDNGGTANGGVDLDATPNTLTIDVTTVNDAPAGTNNTVTTLEDSAYTFAAVDFGFSDAADSPSNTLSGVSITTLPAAGSLTLSGVAVTAGQTISAANITAGNLRFAPGLNGAGASYASFTFQVQDNGGTASGGVDLDATPNTLTIAVTAVNDAPTGTDNAVTAPEDSPYTFVTADFGFNDASDSPGNALSGVRITTLPGAGTLVLSGAAVSAGQTVSAVDIASGNLQLLTTANASGAGYASFAFQVQDNGGTANGGVSLDAAPNTMTIDIGAVDDAPIITNNTLTLTAGDTLVLSSLDLGATDLDDPAGSLMFAVSAVTHGRFELAGAPGVAVGSFTQAQVAAGQVRFVHDASSDAPTYGISVSDGTFSVGPSFASISFTPPVVVAPEIPTPSDPPPAPTPQLPTPTDDSSGEVKSTAPEEPREQSSDIALAAPADQQQTPDGTVTTFNTEVAPRIAQRIGSFTVQSAVLAGGTVATPVALETSYATVPTLEALSPHQLSFSINAPSNWSISSAYPDSATIADKENDGNPLLVSLDSTQLGGMALSAGAVWWASRITGLVGSLLASVPAWRQLDPLLVVNHKTGEEDETADDFDADAEADEIAIAMVLEGPSARRAALPT